MIFKKYSFRTSLMNTQPPFGNQGVGVNPSIDSETDEQRRRRLQRELGLLRDDAAQSAGVMPEEWGTNLPSIPYVPPVPPRSTRDVPPAFSGNSQVGFTLPSLSPSPNLEINRAAQTAVKPADVTYQDMTRLARNVDAGFDGRTPLATTGQTLSDASALFISNDGLGNNPEQRARIQGWLQDPTRTASETAVGIAARAEADRNRPKPAVLDRYGQDMTDPYTANQFDLMDRGARAAEYLGRATLGSIGKMALGTSNLLGGIGRLETAGRMLESLSNANRIGQNEEKLNPYKTPEDAGLVTTLAYAGGNSVMNAYWWETNMADQIGMQLPMWVATAAVTTVAAPVVIPARALLLLEALSTPLESWLLSKSPQVVLAIGRFLAPAVAPTSKAVGNALLSAASESLLEALDKGDEVLTATGDPDKAKLEMGKNFYQGTVALLGTNLAEDLIVNKLIPFHAARYINNAPTVAKHNNLLRQVTARTVGDTAGLAFSILKEMTEERLQEAIQMNAGGSLLGNLYQGLFNPDDNQQIKTAGIEGAKFAFGFRSAGAIRGATDTLNALAGNFGPNSLQAIVQRGLPQPEGVARYSMAALVDIFNVTLEDRLEAGRQNGLTP